MNFRKNLTCCVSSPVCHLLALLLGSLSLIQLIHTNAHYQMEADVDSYITAFCKKNTEKCQQILDRIDY
jgi:hypothetical protein